MIFFDVRCDNQPTSMVSIRKMAQGVSGSVATSTVYAYEVSSTSGKKTKHRGTVIHQGPEDFSLIAAVLNDYVSSNGR
jgi:hypothetical protein